ncbi:sigma-70 family RNA polymerase sigma factor [Micromonospora violae]|uniref:sigma-70 family RNA polymerase sigma factor n=1 Tax=Micromonospora violae TaxID=1278207 RepID=UPI0033E78FAE
MRRRAALNADDPDRARLRDQIIEANLPMAGRLARRYTGRGESYDDLAQVGALGLIKAVDGYDSSRGVPFASYAVPTILGGIRKHFRDTAWAIRVPRAAQELGAQVPEARGRLAQQRGRQPTDRELADDLEVTVAQLGAAVAALGVYRLASLNVPRPGADGMDRRALSGAADAGYTAVDDQLTLGDDDVVVRPIAATGSSPPVSGTSTPSTFEGRVRRALNVRALRLRVFLLVAVLLLPLVLVTTFADR